MKTLLLIAAVATLAVAADKPNFSGDWKLDISKSNLGPLPPPTAMTRKVTQEEPAITVVNVTTGGPQGDQNVTLKYSTDGKESANNVTGIDTKSTASWEGNALVIVTKLEVQGTEIKVTEKWSLSEDGKVMTDLQHIAMGQGEFDITYVMTKQ